MQIMAEVCAYTECCERPRGNRGRERTAQAVMRTFRSVLRLGETVEQIERGGCAWPRKSGDTNTMYAGERVRCIPEVRFRGGFLWRRLCARQARCAAKSDEKQKLAKRLAGPHSLPWYQQFLPKSQGIFNRSVGLLCGQLPYLPFLYMRERAFRVVSARGAKRASSVRKHANSASHDGTLLPRRVRCFARLFRAHWLQAPRLLRRGRLRLRKGAAMRVRV